MNKVYITEISSNLYQITYVTNTDDIDKLMHSHDVKEDDFITAYNVAQIMNDSRFNVILERDGKEDYKNFNE